MAHSQDHKLQTAWHRVEALGGHGVLDGDFAAVVLASTSVTDEDLRILDDLPMIQILDLSHTRVGDDGLKHVERIPGLELLVVVGTQISDDAIERFRASRPGVEVKLEPAPQNKINPFTGQPFGPEP